MYKIFRFNEEFDEFKELEEPIVTHKLEDFVSLSVHSQGVNQQLYIRCWRFIPNLYLSKNM